MSKTFDLQALNQEYEQASPETILHWAAEEFGDRVVVSSSFQTQSVALLHLISQVAPQLRVIFVDTGYHFPETLAYRDQLAEQFGLNIVTVSAEKRQDIDSEGNPLHRTNPDLCCALHKTAPMSRALADCDAWISGIRRDQTATRRNAQPIEQQADGLYKVNVLLNWTSRDLWKYINRLDLPVHPLFSQGYQSIGCAPCTRAIGAGEDERAGRWAGQGKIECGLHTADIRVATVSNMGNRAAR
jgi:phosphoadenosine phosphosulfate reductase